MVAASECTVEVTLHDVVSDLADLRRQIAELAEKADGGFAEVGARLDALTALEERGAPSFPTVADDWAARLHDLVGARLTPPLVPVCARLVMGMRAKEIAADLGRPLTTVKSQIAAIRERFNLTGSEEIPLYVFQRFWDFYGTTNSRGVHRESKGR